MSAIPVKYFEHQILSKIDSILFMISDIKFSKTAVVPDCFLDLLDEILGKVRDNFISEIEDIRAADFDDEEGEITKLALTYMALLRALHEKLFIFLDISEYVFVSNETLFTLRNLVKKVSKDFEIALVPTWEYSYCVYTYKDLYKNLASTFGLNGTENKKYPKWFLFLKYPNIEATNILLNCIFSHEIAHFKDYIDNISGHLIEYVKVDEKKFNEHLELLLKQKISKTANNKNKRQLTIEDFAGRESLRQDLYAAISTVIGNWLKEIVADLLALRTFGPAFLYSLIDSSVLLQIMDNYTDSHPASSWRIGYCLTELKNIGFMKDLKNDAIKQYLENWVSYLKETHKEPNYPIYNVSFISLNNALNKIVKFIRIVSNPFTFNTIKYNEISEEIKSAYFLRCIPPIALWEEDHHKYFNNIFTLNAAWEVFLTDKSRFYKNFDVKDINDKVKANEVLNRLTLKAIESSDILRLWQESA